MALNTENTNSSTNKPRRSPEQTMRIIQMLFGLAFVALAISFSLILYFSYKNYVRPDNVYGTWLEIGAPPYNTETLKFSEHGVYRNGRLIATKFAFNGSKIEVQTGDGLSVYEMSGTADSPQLRRLEPSSPTQRLIKSGYEDTIASPDDDSQTNRRSALRAPFSDQ